MPRERGEDRKRERKRGKELIKEDRCQALAGKRRWEESIGEGVMRRVEGNQASTGRDRRGERGKKLEEDGPGETNGRWRRERCRKWRQHVG